MQDCISVCIGIMICATVVNTQTDRQLLTSYACRLLAQPAGHVVNHWLPS